MMAFYQQGGYPPQNYYQQQMQPTPQPTASPLWVQGEAAAKAFPVAPGSSVILMDSESNTFYIKAADPSGMPSMRAFDYVERMHSQNPPAQAAQLQHGDYVTRAEFAALCRKFDALTQPAPVIIEKEAE